ncbi:GGDEF domain-containing protein [Piscinibacter sp. HJYY11]|uniref:GGDEF domain-containing protein n=1 Tax=Piscinibacter sp. HJYY11 TaxID=2801333 RepID=UPI00191CC8A6|nr:GGDEF domain-containing protein [Piscinibacter sp. HJYY11]MBL0727774.1 GGDEF domain-containing protein [Piscinibacter sp. HJYY11]
MSDLTHPDAGRAPGRSQAGPHPLGGSADVPVGRGAVKPDRRYAHHLNNQRLILVSYLIDGLVLVAFHFAGTIGWLPVLAYTGSGLLITAVTYTLIASGFTQRFRDSGITVGQTIPAQVLQLACMAFVPEVSFMFALLLFIVYCTLTLSLDVTRSLIAWAIAATSAAGVLAVVGTPLHIPNASTAEQVISFAFFVITLWRCVLIGSFNRQMTSRLKARGRELAELTAKVDLLAHHDELTGVMNRRSLFAALRDELQRADRSKQPLCVAIMDLDRFKAVNDQLGHLAGDKTLKIFAGTLSALTRKADRFGRYGGEEFLLVMTSTELDTAEVPIDRMRGALKEADWSSVAPGFSMTFSCGIAAYRPGETPEALLQRADSALYRAKRDGRDCTRVDA